MTGPTLELERCPRCGYPLDRFNSWAPVSDRPDYRICRDGRECGLRAGRRKRNAQARELEASRRQALEQGPTPELGHPLQVRAWFSEDQARRWLLSAWWAPGRRLLWVMCNPSLAGSGAHRDDLDPTLRRVRTFTEAAGFPGFDVVNLYDLISPDPAALAAEAVDDLGANRSWIVEAAASAPAIVAAWGTHPKAVARAPRVARLILGYGPAGSSLLCLGTTKAGHPLYVKGATKLRPWCAP